MKYLWAVVGLLVVGAVLFVIDRLTTMPPALPPDTVSSKMFSHGFYRVATYPVSTKDSSRTNPNSKSSLQVDRNIDAMLWYPQIEDGMVAPGKHPLYLHIPQFSESYRAFSHAAKMLASKGYIVVTIDPNYARKGNNLLNAITGQIDQAKDIHVLLDTLTAWNSSPDTPFYSRIDFNRVAISGYSTGTMAAQLVAFHPVLRDERIDAAIFMAPVTQLFTPALFDTDITIPVLVVAARNDNVAPYESNAVAIAKHYKNTVLVNIKNGSHAGFSSANRRTRWLPNPDAFNCQRLSQALQQKEEKPLAELATLAPDIVAVDSDVSPCAAASPGSLEPVRQYQLSLLAVQTFTESLFADTAFERTVARDFLTNTYTKENPEARVFLPLSNGETPPATSTH